MIFYAYLFCKIVIFFCSKVEASQARLRICLMLNHLLKLMGEDASIDDDLYQKIFDNMLLRLKDKVADIRGQAVTALQRLQVTFGMMFCFRTFSTYVLLKIGSS